MSYLPEFRDVRVTRRVSIAKDFVAPDMAPVSTHALEMEKGAVGWTDFDVHVESVTSDRQERRLASQRLAQAMVGDQVIRKA